MLRRRVGAGAAASAAGAGASAAAFARAARAFSSSFPRQHCLYFFPDPQWQGSLRPRMGSTCLASEPPLYRAPRGGASPPGARKTGSLTRDLRRLTRERSGCARHLTQVNWQIIKACVKMT